MIKPGFSEPFGRSIPSLNTWGQTFGGRLVGNLSQVELVTACSKKRESQKSFMCEQLEWWFLGMQCVVCTEHPLQEHWGFTAQSRGTPWDGQIFPSHRTCGLECWSRNSQGMDILSSLPRCIPLRFCDILLLIISEKHWECPHNSDSMGRARHPPQLGSAASFNVHT